VSQLDLSGLPAWLQEAIRKLLLPGVEAAAPAAFHLALDWLEREQLKYNNASAARLYEEMAGIAHGACAAAEEVTAASGVRRAGDSNGACDEAQLLRTIHRLNMLPDLIHMQCSMLGAWGDATANGKLVQLRSLDFGGGPFGNNSVLLVHHPAGTGLQPAGRPFAALSFPGFVGVVTGVSPRVALSEKVNDIHGGGTPAGSYSGESTAFVIREMLELADTKEAAHAIAQAATRTWGVWLGVGDAASQRFVAIEYMRASAHAYNDSTLPALTGQPPLPDVAYIDKHAQPSADPLLHKVLAPQVGRITSRFVAQNVPRLTQSGDVHIAVYDFDPQAPSLYVALGSTSANGTYDGPGGRKACDAPYVRFAADALWAEPPPLLE